MAQWRCSGRWIPELEELGLRLAPPTAVLPGQLAGSGQRLTVCPVRIPAISTRLPHVCWGVVVAGTPLLG